MALSICFFKFTSSVCLSICFYHLYVLCCPPVLWWLHWRLTVLSTRIQNMFWTKLYSTVWLGFKTQGVSRARGKEVCLRTRLWPDPVHSCKPIAGWDSEDESEFSFMLVPQFWGETEAAFWSCGSESPLLLAPSPLKQWGSAFRGGKQFSGSEAVDPDKQIRRSFVLGRDPKSPGRQLICSPSWEPNIRFRGRKIRRRKE